MSSTESDGYFLKRFEILPGFQGLGIGTWILRDVLRQAASESQPVRLQVFKANPARRLYSRLGFETVDETKHHHVMVMPAPEPSDAGRAGMPER